MRTIAMMLIALLSLRAAIAAADKIPAANNPVMKSLYDDDQRVRQPGYRGDWRDKERRAKVRKLLDQDAIKTPTDYEEAAIVFQHGDVPDDFLIAHTLAIIAVARGDKSAIWVASATLDRYLQRI